MDYNLKRRMRYAAMDQEKKDALLRRRRAAYAAKKQSSPLAPTLVVQPLEKNRSMLAHCSTGFETTSIQVDTPFGACEIPDTDVQDIMGSDELADAFDVISERLASNVRSQNLLPQSSLPVSSNVP